MYLNKTVNISITNNISASNANYKVTADGGYAVKMVNKTGALSIKGEVVRISATGSKEVVKTLQNVPDAIGVFADAGVADGAEAWVITSGIADVYFIGNTTKGYLARTFVTADAGFVAGQALSEVVPSSPFASDKHFAEIGHLLETRVGAGLAKCILHFN